jgi:hypothetical protein
MRMMAAKPSLQMGQLRRVVAPDQMRSAQATHRPE